MGTANTSPAERKESRVEKYTEENNVKDIQSELSKLKKEVGGKETAVSATDEIDLGNNTKETRDTFAKEMDTHVEDAFDKYVKANKDHIKELLKKWAAGQKELETEFDTKIWAKALDGFTTDKNILDANLIKQFKFELSDLKQDVIEMVKAETWADNAPFNTVPGAETGKNIEFYINPNNLKSTTIGSYKYCDLDLDKDGKVSKKERKEAGIVDRYANRNKDKKTAIFGILHNGNLENDEDLKKRDIRSIDRDDLTNILDDVLTDDFLEKVEDSNGKIDKKSFRKAFREEFTKEDRYKRKGLINLNEINKIADIIEKSLKDKPDQTWLREDLQGLADIGETVKNMDYTAAWNDEVLLKKIDPENVFLFLCDFDSDGIINSKDVWTTMGGQLYTNFLEYATVEFKDTDNDGKEEKYITDGPETSALIVRLLKATANESDNGNLKIAINDFISKKTENGGTITMEDFKTFMSEGYTYTPIWSEKEITVTTTKDIKEFIKTISDQLNESKDLSRLFVDQKIMQEKILESSKIITDIKNTETWVKNHPFYTATIKDDYKDLTSTEQFTKDFNNPEELENIRSTAAYNTIKVINYLTDLIYLDLWNTSDTVIGGIFNGAEIGGIKYTFNDKDKTLNGRKVKDVLGQYIFTRLNKSVGIWFDPDGKPVLWASLSYEKTSDDLWNKFEAEISANVNLAKLKFNFNLWASKARQVNESHVSRLSTKKPIPVNRIGMEVWAGIDTKKLQISPYVWVFFERDFPAGIEQSARAFDRMVKKVLSYDDIQIYNSYDDYQSGMIKNLDKLIATDEEVKTNQYFLKDMIKQIGKEMQRAGVFELIAKQTDERIKKNILEYMYSASIDAFHENAKEQWWYEQLAWRVKLTKFGLKSKLVDIISRAWLGAAAGSAIPGWGTVFGAVTWTFVGAMTFSTRKTSYKEDAVHKWRQNYMDIQTGLTAEDHQEILDKKDINILAEFLDKELNPNEKLLNVTSKDDKILITGINGTDPKEYLNIYYSENALTENAFSLENNVLTLGNASLRVTRDIKRNKVETFLMIGEAMWGKMTKLESDKSTSEKVKKFSEIPYYAEFSKPDIQGFVEKDPNLALHKDKILWFFNDDGTLIADKNVPATLQGTKIKVGTLKFKEASDGTVSLESYDPNTFTDKLKIEYTVQTKISTENTKTIENEKYKETPISAEKLFTPDTKFTNVFTTTTEKISSCFDDVKDYVLYKDFMIPIVDKWIDNFINETDYDTAFIKLREILQYNQTKYNSLTDLKSLIEEPAITESDKVFVVDKFKAIFSYITDLTDGNADGTNLTYLMNRHGPVYKKGLLGPDGTTSYPLTTDYRTTIVNTLQKESSLQRQTVENLIGFTAFYRLSGKWRGYSMTALGATNVLSNGNLETSMAKIDNADELSKTQEWFTKNLDVNTANKDIILAKLNKQLESQKIILTADKLNSLFKWEDISIDNWQKIVKLDLQYYFYLLGECANESIGARINNINIYEKLEGEYVETTIDGTTGGIEKKKRGVSLQAQTLNAEYDINATQNDLIFKNIFTKKRTGKAEGTAWESKEPGGGPTPWEGGEGHGTTWDEGQKHIQKHRR